MGVMIKGMVFPSSCEWCNLRVYCEQCEGISDKCAYTGERIPDNFNGKMDDCPLEEIKENNESKENKNVKMCELFTAEYSDGRRVYEQRLEWIYSHRNGSNVEIRPCIWLWNAGSVFMVDFVGKNIGCTLGAFDNLKAAESFKEQISNMTKEDFALWLSNSNGDFEKWNHQLENARRE